uniref:NADH dehydrogenase subunit 4L n=1 Tax=Bryozoa sp. TaxID=2813608 RepID=A0AAU8L2J5_9BILA
MSVLILILYISSIYETSLFLFLLKLESMIVLMYFMSYFIFYSSDFLICMLVMAIVEGCMGLICLIIKIRNEGKDLIFI